MLLRTFTYFMSTAIVYVVIVLVVYRERTLKLKPIRTLRPTDEEETVNDLKKCDSVRKNQTDAKLVLYWYNWRLVTWDWGVGSMCDGRCVFTRNRSLLATADAVIVARDLSKVKGRPWPPRHHRTQVFVATGYEPPSKFSSRRLQEYYISLNSSDVTHYFNLTLSYRHDSDVVVKYHDIMPRKEDDSTEDLNLPKDVDRKQVVWISSHCTTPIQREKLVQKLHSYNVSVDIYGECGRRLWTCDWTDTKNLTNKDPHCLHDIVKHYKFYVAFENSLCTDYLTEKSAQFMNVPSLPIVMSYAKVDELLPPKSYLNVFDFKSVKDLAEYILYLDRKFDKYMEYFTWRHKWKIKTFLKMLPEVKCDLCDLLHTNYSKSYNNLAEWFAGPKVCNLDGLKTHFTDFEE